MKLSLLVTACLVGGAQAVIKDTLLREDFCPQYYWGTGDCEALKTQVKYNHATPAPILQLGDPSKPPMFFFHGWPDTGAMWVNQFEYFCGPKGDYFCVAPTWMNFHPDLPNEAKKNLFIDVQVDRMGATAKELGLKDITLVIFDWGADLGYKFTYKFPELVKKIVAFDIGMNIPTPAKPKMRAFGDAMFQYLPDYQVNNIKAYRQNNDTMLSEWKGYLKWSMWRGHDPEFFSARIGWPYDCIVMDKAGEEMSERFAPGVPLNEWAFENVPTFPDGIPIQFMYGLCQDGTGCESCANSGGKTCKTRPYMFFQDSFEAWVKARPGSEVVAVDGAGHWMMTQQSAFVNEQMARWLTPAAAPAAPGAGTPTTKNMTAFDSSASSGASSASASSASLNSFGSGPAGSSSSGDSFNTGSSASDPSGSASSGSTASGSWGSQLQIWQWFVLLLLCCCLGAGAASMMGGKKAKKKKTKKKSEPKAPEPVAEPVVEPLLADIPPLMPLQTTSQLIPSYSMVAPQTGYTYAMPSTMAYGGAQQYAQPAMYAQPGFGTTTGMVV